MLTTEEINAYQIIHKRIFNTEITPEIAREQGGKLIVFLENIFKH